MVFSGHFHHKSDNGTIYYLGNPYQTNWMDYKDPRGFHMFDFETRELTFIENPYEMFHKYFYNDLEWTVETVQAEDFDKWKNCYVKIIVENKTNQNIIKAKSTTCFIALILSIYMFSCGIRHKKYIP